MLSTVLGTDVDIEISDVCLPVLVNRTDNDDHSTVDTYVLVYLLGVNH